MQRQMTIKYYRKNTYGRDLIYLADEKIAKNYESLTGRKTITSKELNTLLDIINTVSSVKVTPEEVIAPNK